jgi:two-component system sensor histidine kinase CreC
MKIGLRLLFGYFLVIGLAAWFLLNVFVQEVKPGVRVGQEDAMKLSTRLMAALVADDVKAGAGQEILQRKLAGAASAAADGHPFRLYITDARGMVIFDSDARAIGQDYSRWNDVYLTLRGKYGARSTRADPKDELSTVMHVAAPVLADGKVVGVLTLAKPNASLQPFIDRSQQQIMQRGGVLLALSLLLGIAFALWLAIQLRRLSEYARAVEAGRKAVLPRLSNTEIGQLGRALEAMRRQLEGKEYVEEVMQTLAHELKSPIAAIQGAAELLQEEMPAEERARFLKHILEQNARERRLIERLLSLVRVEKQQGLAAPQPVPVAALLATVRDDCAVALRDRPLKIDADESVVLGDALLLRQALGNLVDNAAGFAPPGSAITLRARRDGEQVRIEVDDCGQGVPDYALDRVFERFYSLARPGGAKSTGLGLPFVREVAALHGGSAGLCNRDGGGARAWIALPLPLFTRSA